jgi:ADP-heptose:LPS heptosyltransferase
MKIMPSLMELRTKLPQFAQNDIKIYRDNDYFKVHFVDLYNHRLGDKVGFTPKVIERRQQIQENEAIVCIDQEYNEIDTKGTYIHISNYFSHLYDAIISVKVKEQRQILHDTIKNTFNTAAVAGHLWEDLIPLRKNKIYYSMHSNINMDRWWSIERVKLGIIKPYIVFNILTDTDYHPCKTVNYGRMCEVIDDIRKPISVVVVGIPNNPKIEMENVFDLCHSGYSIDQSIAIIKGCNIFCGGDTGIAHVAGAFDKPVIQAFPGAPEFHCDTYDARPCIPDYRYRRVFLYNDGEFDTIKMRMNILEFIR